MFYDGLDIDKIDGIFGSLVVFLSTDTPERIFVYAWWSFDMRMDKESKKMLIIY